MEEYNLTNMTQEDAILIANQWKYEGIYHFYDITEDPKDYEEFITPETRQNYYTVRNKTGDLCGYFCFSLGNDAADIGLGMAPEYVGKGNGVLFLNQCIHWLTKQYPQISMVTLSVASFNQRGIKTYQRCGFQKVKTSMRETNGATYEFYDMKKDL